MCCSETPWEYMRTRRQWPRSPCGQFPLSCAPQGTPCQGPLPSRLSQCACASGCAHWFELVEIHLVPSHWGQECSRGCQSVVPLLTNAASAPLASLPGQRRHTSHSVSPKTVKCGGCSAAGEGGGRFRCDPLTKRGGTGPDRPPLGSAC